MSLSERILAVLKRGEASGPIIAERLGKSANSIQIALVKLRDRGAIVHVRGNGVTDDPRVWALSKAECV